MLFNNKNILIHCNFLTLPYGVGRGFGGNSTNHNFEFISSQEQIHRSFDSIQKMSATGQRRRHGIDSVTVITVSRPPRRSREGQNRGESEHGAP
jgi:hypothetical protein